MNKDDWVLNADCGMSISFKQETKEDYNLIDLRKLNDTDSKMILSLYLDGKKTKYILFENRKEGLKYLFKVYPFLKKLKGGIKNNGI